MMKAINNYRLRMKQYDPIGFDYLAEEDIEKAFEKLSKLYHTDTYYTYQRLTELISHVYQSAKFGGFSLSGLECFEGATRMPTTYELALILSNLTEELQTGEFYLVFEKTSNEEHLGIYITKEKPTLENSNICKTNKKDLIDEFIAHKHEFLIKLDLQIQHKPLSHWLSEKTIKKDPELMVAICDKEDLITIYMELHKLNTPRIQEYFLAKKMATHSPPTLDRI